MERTMENIDQNIDPSWKGLYKTSGLIKSIWFLEFFLSGSGLLLIGMSMLSGVYSKKLAYTVIVCGIIAAIGSSAHLISTVVISSE